MANLTAQSRITEVCAKQGRRGGTLTFAVMVPEYRDETGRLVAEAKLTGVETAQAWATFALDGEADAEKATTWT